MERLVLLPMKIVPNQNGVNSIKIIAHNLQ